MTSNHSEKLLAAVQELRNHLRSFPEACADIDRIQRYWLPSQLFPPDESIVHKALHVLINAGELVRFHRGDQVVFQSKAPLEELDLAIHRESSALQITD